MRICAACIKPASVPVPPRQILGAIAQRSRGLGMSLNRLPRLNDQDMHELRLGRQASADPKLVSLGPSLWRQFRWVGSANRAEIMFDVLMTFLIGLSFGLPAMPWFFGARWGSRGVWLSTGFAVVILLCFFPILFWVACGACGQGAIAIFVLGPIWIASALLTVTSAAFAYYKFAR